MDKSLGQDLSDHGADAALLAQIEQLRPALKGFPVQGLVELLMQAAPRERATAQLLMDRCLGHWIASLDLNIRSFMPCHDDDTLQRLHSLQCGARDALAQLQSALARAGASRPN